MISNATIVQLRHTPGGVDEYGDPIPSTTTETTISNGAVAPRSSSDNLEPGRTGVIVGLTLFLPHGWDVRTDDQFRVDGVVYDIDGTDGSWQSPFTGWQAGVEVALRRSEG